MPNGFSGVCKGPFVVNFSQRTSWQRRPNALSAALETRRARGLPVIDLTLSNPTRAGLAYPESLWNALRDVDHGSYVPDARGLPEARRAVSAYYAARNINVDAHRLLLTSSTSEAYALLFKVLADPGDRVLVPRPSYPLLQYLADLEGIELGYYPLRYDGVRWMLDTDRLAAAVDARTRAVVLVNPNNPTGSYISAEERRVVETLCCECGLAVISDEVFFDYPLGEQRGVSFASEGRGLHVALGGLSKALALPQAKLGWMAVGGDAALRDEALARLEIAADTYLSVGSGIQRALPALMASCEALQAEVIQRVRANYGLLCDGVEGAELVHSEGGWYGVLRIEGDEEALALALLEREGVLVHPGYFYDFAGGSYWVLSLLAEDIAAGLAGIARVLEANR